MQTITIPKKEYSRLKKLEKIDFELMMSMAYSILKIFSIKL